MFGSQGRLALFSGLLIAVVAGGQGAGAETLTSDQIKQALTPHLTRSLSIRTTPTAAQADDEAFVDSLRNKASRSLTVGDRTKLVEVADKKPSIDLSMEFGYNSSTLRGPALDTADKLGTALTAPDLKGQTFLIAGYTDAKGNDQGNMQLSERRADSVKRYLVSKYHIVATNLIAVGYGKTNLKNPSSPFAPENRRVQAVNILPFKSAGN